MGWSPRLQTEWETCAPEGTIPGRVVRAERERYTVVTALGDVAASLGGRLRHTATGPLDLPSVGDWVAFSQEVDGAEGVIRAVLPRRSVFLRKAAGSGQRAQVVAANLDAVFLVLAMNGDFNLRRLERYLSATWESGAQPVVVLTKRDLASDPEGLLAAAQRASPGAAVVSVHAPSGEGLDALGPFLTPGATVALLGSSGAGKSTLLNALAGAEIMATGALRASDARGQHTTTTRALVALPCGALLVDTPGMRELGMWDVDEGLDRAFDDIAALAEGCRFRDCAHAREKGCAVQAALAEGTLAPERLESFQKLVREAAFQQQRHDPQAQAEARAKWKQISMAQRQMGRLREK